MAFVALTAAETDAKSPVDDLLFGKVRDNFDDLNSRLIAAKTFPYDYRINGPLSFINPRYGYRKRLDGALISGIQTLTFAKLYCETPGVLGALSVDIRKYKKTDTPITSILRQYNGAINSISQIAPSIATQSITRATAQIATQSITRFKAALNITSIILLGNNLVRYNLSSAPDSDWTSASSVLIASATTGANNGTFTIVRTNDDGGNNIVITNASGVAQTGAAGNINLNLWSYNYVNPVSTEFTAGENVLLASHTAGGSDGSLPIYAINNGGNNIIVNSSSPVAQAGVAGTADVQRWTFTYASAVPSDFVAGEYARMAGHTSGGNNADLLITAINSGGNNIIVYNTSGVLQGGVAGTANTTRWVYALASDPSSQVSATDTIVIASATTAANNGVFTVKQVNRSATNNVVVSNVNGVTQVGAAGTVASARILVAFSSDQSAVYTTSSNIEISETVANVLNAGYYDVLQVNRGGGSNYNVVISNTAAVEQVSPAGRIMTESKSVLAAPLTLAFPTSGTNTVNNSALQIAATTSMSSEAVFSSGDIAAGAVLAVDIISIPSGNISDIVIQTA